MSKARIIGAGTAGSTNYNTNVNLNTAGGTKKQGYPAAVGDYVNNRAINTRARGENNNIIFPMNQMQGGVHKPIRIYDGNAKFAPYDYYQPKATQEFLHFPLAQGPETWADGTNSFTIGATELVYNGNTTTWANVAAKISESRALFTPTDDFTLNVNNRVAMHSGGNITTLGQVTGTALGATLFDIRGAGYLSSIGHLILGSTSAKSTVVTYSSGTKGLQVNPLGAVAFNAAAAVSAGVVTLQDGAFGAAGQVLTSNGSSAPPSWTSMGGGGTTLEQAITNGGGVANSSFQIQEAGTLNYSQMADDGVITQNVTTFFPPFTTTTTSNLSPASLVLTNSTNGITITATLEKDSLAYAITGGSYEAEYTKDHMRVLDNSGQPKQTSIYPNQLNLYDSTFAVGSRSLIIERNKFQIGTDTGTAGQVLGKDVGGNLAWTTPKTPTLQQVCDVGSTTDTGITVQVGAVSSVLDEANLTFSGNSTIASGSLTISAAGTNNDLSLDTTDGDISVTVNGLGRTFTVSAAILQINQGSGAAGEVLTYQADGSAEWAALPAPTLQAVTDASNVTTNELIVKSSATTYTTVDGDSVTFSNAAGDASLTNVAGTLQIEAPFTTISVPTVNTAEKYIPNSEFGDALLVYNDVGVVPGVSDGFAEVIFQNISPTAHSSNIIAICDKDGDHMKLGQVSNTAVGSTLFDVRGAGYTSSSGHHILGASSTNSTVVTYASGMNGLQVNPLGAVAFDASTAVSSGVVTLQDGGFGTAGQVLTSQGGTAPPTWTTVDTTLEEAITNGGGVANSSFQIQEAGTLNYSQMANDGFITQNVTTFFPPFTTTTTSNLSPTSLILANLTNGTTITATLEKDSLTYAVTGGSYEAEYTKTHMRVLDNGGQPKQTSIYPNQINLYDSTFVVGNRSLFIERNKFQIGSDSGTAGQVIGKDAGGNLAWTSPSTPTLQQVCDVGSTTDTGITVQVGAVSSELDETSLTLTDGVYNTTYKYNEIETDASFTISSDDISIGTTATAGSVITAGWYTNATEFSQTNFRGQVEFVDLCPHTSIEPTFGTDLTNKGYVDRVVGNYSGNGLTLYFNIPSANPNPITSVPISYDLGQTLIAVNATPSAAYYTLESTALGLSHHIASFTTAAGFPNVTTIPVGLWSMLVYGFVSGQGGTLNYYFELWETDSAGVELVQIGTSGDTSDVNATNALAPDAYHATLAITSPVSLASTSSRLRIKIYTRGVGMGGGVTLSTLFGGTYYSFITTSLSSSNALLTTNNTWTGTNNFGTGLFSTQTISAPATSSPVSLFLGQSAGGDITVGSAAVDTTINGTLRATTPLTNTNDTVVPTTSWTTTFFGAKATTNTWDLLQTFTSNILTQGILAITKASPVGLFTDQIAGGDITMGTTAADTTINGTSTKLYGKVTFNDQLFNGGDGGGSYTGLAYTIPADANRNTYFTLTVTGTNPTPPQAVVTLPVADLGGKFIHIFNAGTSVIRIDGSLARRIFGGGAGTAGIVQYFLYVNQTLQLFSAGPQGFLVLGATTGNQGFGSPSVVATPSPNTQLLRNRITTFTGSPQTVTFVPNVYGGNIPSVSITPVGGTGVTLSSQTPAGFVFAYIVAPTALNWIAVW
jgi:hypothetical protein